MAQICAFPALWAVLLVASASATALPWDPRPRAPRLVEFLVDGHRLITGGDRAEHAGNPLDAVNPLKHVPDIVPDILPRGRAKRSKKDPMADRKSESTKVSNRLEPKHLKATDLRPHAGQGPEKIAFGIYVKAVSLIDMKAGNFVADVVLTLSWPDRRTAGLPGEGRAWVSLSAEEAEERIWIPDVMISNRDRKSVDVISTSFNVSRAGRVTQVQRILAKFKNTFSVHAFPFDHQALRIVLASSTLMADELVLVPTKKDGYFGVKDGIFKGRDFSLVHFNATSFVEEDALLEKSRGELELLLKRDAWPYVQNLLVPCWLLLGLSYSVFWFPEIEVFVMPRTFTALIAFLSLMAFSLRTAQILPVRGGLAWIDLFEQSCQGLMCQTVWFNIFAQIIQHKFELKGLSRRLDVEMKFVFPLMAGIVFTIGFSKIGDDQDLDGLSGLVNLILLLTGGFITSTFIYRVKYPDHGDYFVAQTAALGRRLSTLMPVPSSLRGPDRGPEGV